MCDQGPGSGSVTGALAMLDRALDCLNAADLAGLPTDTQAAALKSLETVEAKHIAARTAMLSAFSASGGPEADGHGVARTWLRWQTRITRGAAASAVAWMRRLAAHPVIEHALARGEISASWARELCAWTGRLPEGVRDDADRLLCQAATDGAGLDDLGRLAEAIYQRTRGPDDDRDDGGFGDRNFHLGITFSGAGRAQGDLSPGCAAALAAVLDALGKKAGPEDTRTAAQRRHDALEDACRRLIATGTLPARGGQPTQVQVHLGLAELRDLPGAATAEQAWVTTTTGAHGAGRGRSGWLTGAEAQATACDATIVPVVTGHLDSTALDRLTDAFVAAHGLARPRPTHAAAASRRPPAAGPGLARPGHRRGVWPGRAGRCAAHRPGRHRTVPGHPAHLDQPPAGHRRRQRSHPGPPAPRRHPAPPALRLPRLRAARQRVRRSPSGTPLSRRGHRPAQPGTAVPVPSPDGHPPLGLDPAPQPRRDHHRASPDGRRMWHSHSPPGRAA